MGRTAAGLGSLGRAWARALRYCRRGPTWFAAVLVLAGLAFSGACRADPVRGEATFTKAGGYARLVLKLAEDVDSEVTTAGSIVVIRFKRPVDIPVEKLADAVPDYVGSARADPDGSAIRLSLSRRATINTMTAGERIFVDFLPDSWTGPPPSLPVEVIHELAERARTAERALRLQRAGSEVRKRPPIRVRTSVQPTFVRFVFEMPDGIGVSSVLNDQKLSLRFNAALSFDLADAKEAAPPNIASINQKMDSDTSAIEITLIGDVDVHSFREEKNYIVDVAFQQTDKSQALSSPAASVAHAAAAAASPQAAPAHDAAPAATASPAPAASVVAPVSAGEAPENSPEHAAPQKSAEVAPPTSEMIARRASIEINPAAAPKTPGASEPSKPEPLTPVTSRPEPPKPESAESESPKSEVVRSEAIKLEPSKESPAKATEPAPAAAMPAAPAASKPPAEAKAATSSASVKAKQTDEGLQLVFSFAGPTPAAAFRRADALWLVFDSTQPIDLEPIRRGGPIVSEVSRMALDKGQAIRIRLSRPQMPSLTGNEQAGGTTWTLAFAETMRTPTQPLVALRNIVDPAFANVAVPLPNPGQLHRLVDPDAGDTLMVVTAPPPVRGFIKRQDFVELSLLESIHGVAIHPNSDDVTAEVSPDKIILGRPGGLTLSSADVVADRATTTVRPIFDVAEWKRNSSDDFMARQSELIAAAGAVEPGDRVAARLDLARFYMARQMYPEAKGVLDLALGSAKPGTEDPIALVIHSIASSLMGRPELALKDLANPAVGGNYDSQLWRALAYVGQEKWALAREKFKNVEFAVTALPTELQRVVVTDAMRASLEVKDYSGAAKRSGDLDVIGVTQEMNPEVSVLHGWLAEALGHDKDALDAYKIAADSDDRASAADAKLREIKLRERRNEISPADMLRELETLSVLWRGDSIEVKTLQMLARIYSDNGHYAESFAAARTATRLQPNSEASRGAQDDTSALFSQLFLGPKGDDLPPIDALAMFYQYRELTPIGRRGDEMIRRLADRLVAVDLLDQAAELLQYQVDKRLEGAARAQVAARLAMVYLTNRKPDRAIAALRSTRITDLSGELRQQRLLLEARAQSDIGRHDLALDIISNIQGREAIRLRSDIYWAARRWREASEQIELYYGDRWRDFKPLSPAEKSDVIRAVVGYALAEDTIGLARFREKYAPLMSGDADRAAFETASKPAAANSAEFGEIAKMAARVDTLDGFMHEMKARFPDATAWQPESKKADPLSTGSLPKIVGSKQTEAAR